VLTFQRKVVTIVFPICSRLSNTKILLINSTMGSAKYQTRLLKTFSRKQNLKLKFGLTQMQGELSFLKSLRVISEMVR
jgi:hypothetical protein